MYNEEGFSLLELAMTAAIMLTITATVSTILISTTNTITEKAEETKRIQEEHITNIIP